MKDISAFIDKIHGNILDTQSDGIIQNKQKYYLNSYKIWLEVFNFYEAFLEKNNSVLNLSKITVLQPKPKKEYLNGILYDMTNNYVVRIRNIEKIEREVAVCSLLKNNFDYYKILASNPYSFITEYIKGDALSTFLLKNKTDIQTLIYYVRYIITQSKNIFDNYNIFYFSKIHNIIITEHKKTIFIDLENAKIVDKNNITNLDFVQKYYYFFNEINTICQYLNLPFDSIFKEIEDVLWFNNNK